jgi:hypothetical protein
MVKRDVSEMIAEASSSAMPSSNALPIADSTTNFNTPATTISSCKQEVSNHGRYNLYFFLRQEGQPSKLGCVTVTTFTTMDRFLSVFVCDKMFVTIKRYYRHEGI